MAFSPISIRSRGVNHRKAIDVRSAQDNRAQRTRDAPRSSATPHGRPARPLQCGSPTDCGISMRRIQHLPTNSTPSSRSHAIRSRIMTADGYAARISQAYLHHPPPPAFPRTSPAPASSRRTGKLRSRSFKRHCRKCQAKVMRYSFQAWLRSGISKARLAGRACCVMMHRRSLLTAVRPGRHRASLRR